MAKIIVDIGLPKTASTTRQFGLFSKLHEFGIINYLGRNSTWHKENNILEQQKYLLAYWQNGTDFNVEDLALESNKINVLSNERFTRVPAYVSLSKELKGVPKLFPELLHKKLKGHDVNILFFLRSQASYLYSEYVNAYSSSEKFKNPKINSLQKFSFTNGYLNQDLIDAGDFGSLMENYVKYFGRNKVQCLFFEDLKNDASNFYERLAEIFNLDIESVKEIYQQNHYKKKDKKGSNYEIPSHISSKTTKSVLKVLNKLFPSLMLFVKGIFKKINPNIEETVVIADFTPEQKEKIKKIFFDSNMKLVELGLVTKEGLEKNGYL